MRFVICAGVLVASGCAAIAGLGDEVSLDPAFGVAEAGPDTTQPDAAVDAKKTTCGLEPSPNAQCADCNAVMCCIEAAACSKNPRCVLGIECLRDCAFQLACINECFVTFADTPELEPISSCSGFKCQRCVPQQECQNLGACCLKLPDAGSQKFLRDTCIGRVYQDDVAECNAFLAARKSEGFCP